MNCGECGVAPGDLHMVNCCVERCARCGGRAVECDCIYEVNGIAGDMLESSNLDVYCAEPTADIRAKYDEEIATVGGRLPWDGECPGKVWCREFGWFRRWVLQETGMPVAPLIGPGRWERCRPNAEGARPDLERLYEEGRWDSKARRWVRR